MRLSEKKFLIMNKFIICAFFSLLSFYVNAQDDGICWLQTTYDFGAFSEDLNEVEAKFKFVNMSEDPIYITQVASSCGCTVPSYSKDEIAPGDTAAIDVKYNAVGRPGRFSKQVYVRTTASHERYKLTIKGVVIGGKQTISARYPVEMGPLKLQRGMALLGKVRMGSGKAEYVEVYNQSSDTLTPIFHNVPPYLQISVAPTSISPGELGTINFFVKGEKLKDWGIISDSIKIIPNDGMDAYDYPFIAIVEEDFSKLTDEELRDAPVLALSDHTIDLGQVAEKATTPISKTLEITNRGKNPLIIRRVYSQDSAVEAKVATPTIKAGKKGTLTVTFDPSAQPSGIINTKLTLIANDPTQPTTTIRIVGTRK